MAEILIVYYSRFGSTARMAETAATGVESVAGAESRLRTVPPVSPTSEATSPAVPDSGPPYAELEDLSACDGLIVGSPTRFANMAAPMKHFLDTTTSLWLNGTLAGRPAACFTSTGSLHGGQETTLITMMLPLLHQGMYLVGLPYTEPDLATTTSGGTPYGASHVAGSDADQPETDEEARLTRALGRRVATLARDLERVEHGRG
jgi:NAD(P)H dehydrogenase (quinone)